MIGWLLLDGRLIDPVAVRVCRCERGTGCFSDESEIKEGYNTASMGTAWAQETAISFMPPYALNFITVHKELARIKLVPTRTNMMTRIVLGELPGRASLPS